MRYTQNMDAQMQVRLRQDEKAAFEKAARLSGMGLSTWVRQRLREVAKAELESAGQSVPFMQKGGKS